MSILNASKSGYCPVSRTKATKNPAKLKEMGLNVKCVGKESNFIANQGGHATPAKKSPNR